jgi:hypothetical protein
MWSIEGQISLRRYPVAELERQKIDWTASSPSEAPRAWPQPLAVRQGLRSLTSCSEARAASEVIPKSRWDSGVFGDTILLPVATQILRELHALLSQIYLTRIGTVSEVGATRTGKAPADHPGIKFR